VSAFQVAIQWRKFAVLLQECHIQSSVALFSLVAYMKVYNLCCEHEHRFEGWFASAEDFGEQMAKLLLVCPVCNSPNIQKLLSAPRLNLTSSQAEDVQRQEVAPADDPRLELARRIVANTEDVGDRFAEEARRIHYRETPERGIRGVASNEECAALAEEGIEIASFPLMPVSKQTLQ
jgi:hypothetical protein